MNDSEDLSFLTNDQLEAYNNIKETYPNATVTAIEGSNKVLVNSGSDQHGNMLKAYLPPEINENTRSYTYYSPGGIGSGMEGSGGSYVIDNAVATAIEDDNDAIFCMTSSDDKGAMGMTSIESILGIDGFNSNTCIGWSQGGKTVYDTTLDKIKNNTNLEPQTMVLLDIQYNGSSLDTSEENLNLMKENGTVIMAFESVETNPNEFRNCENYKTIAQAGIPIVIVEMPGDHGGTPSTAFKDDLIAFLNGDIDEIPSAYGFYTYNENGEYVEMDSNEAIEIMRQNLTPIFDKDQTEIDKLFTRLNDDNKLYKMHIKCYLESINSMSTEFLTTDAGFLANNINAIISKVNNTKIKELNVSANYASTTYSPKIQDVKIMEYVTKTNELLSKVLYCIEFAMKTQLQLQEMENDIKGVAEGLPGAADYVDDISVLTAALAGLPFTIDPTLSDEERASELERLTDLTYENIYGEKARNAASEKGLTGSKADEYVETYLDVARKNYESTFGDSNINVTIDDTTVTETPVSGN